MTRLGKIISIANQKGGVGKTTTAINLSAYLAMAGYRVLTVDIDPQGNTTSGLGIDKRAEHADCYDVIIEGLPVGSAILPTAIPDLFLLPGGIALAGAEVELVARPHRESILRDALAPIKDAYDYILVDCPPSLGLLTLNALTASDSVLIPLQCEYYALEGVTQFLDTVRLVKGSSNPALDIEGILLTMHDLRTRLSVQVMDEVKKHFRGKVFATAIPRNVRLGEAPSHGLPVCLYDTHCSGAQAYAALAQEIIENNGGTAQ